MGALIHPTATSLIPAPSKDAQSLERDHRPAGEHLKSSTKELLPLQAVSQLHWEPSYNTSMETHVAKTIKKKKLGICTCLHSYHLTGITKIWWMTLMTECWNGRIQGVRKDRDRR